LLTLFYGLQLVASRFAQHIEVFHMSQSSNGINHTPLIVLTLAMALGPLTALSVGSRYADEETLARAQAGAENIERRAMQAAMNLQIEENDRAEAYVGATPMTNDRDS
jgi:hypothetical protein